LRFYLSLFILLLLLAVAFIFGSQNDQIITLNYLIARTEMSVAMAVSLFTFIGILIGIFLMLMWKFSRVVKKKLSLSENSLNASKVNG